MTHDVTAEPSEADRDLRDRLDAAIDEVFARWQNGLGDERPQDAIRDAVLAALPAPAHRTAVLREASAVARDEAVHLYDDMAQKAAAGARLAADRLSRMADEAQLAEEGR